MVIDDLIKAVRFRINDSDVVGFQNDELLDYINMGIQYLHRIVTRERPELVAKTEEIKEEPYRLSNKAIRILESPSGMVVRMDGSLDTTCKAPFTVRYVPDMESLKSSDTFPYPTTFRTFVVEFAAIRAQLRNEFDMSQENALIAQIESQILEVIWGIQNERSDIEPYFPVRHRSSDYGGVDL